MSSEVIIFFVIAVIFAIIISMYNSFIALKNKTEEAFSTMDIYLKKRYDLVLNLVDTVKGYAANEQETLEKVVQARNMALSANNLTERQENENMLSGTLKSLFALSENYPQLKADTGFVQLQDQLSKLEDEISQSRKYYNAVVKTINTKIEMFPSNFIAQMMKLEKFPFFIVEEVERQNVQVKF